MKKSIDRKRLQFIRATSLALSIAAGLAGISCGGEQEDSLLSAPQWSKKTSASKALALSYSHSGRFRKYQGTKTCLKCHLRQALEVHSSIHYQWKGRTDDVVNIYGLAGKLGSINSFCTIPDINWLGLTTNLDGKKINGGCAKCHAGLGKKPRLFPTWRQLKNIDCLICHSKTYKRKVKEIKPGVYRMVPDTENMSVSIHDAAKDITPPDRERCLHCHGKSGGGENLKRGDLEMAHANPPREMDVHMSAGITCQDCHTTINHRIPGRGSDLRPTEGWVKVNCTRCHTATPHKTNPFYDHHAEKVSCTTCHIPTFAFKAPTDVERDWSKPGQINSSRIYKPYSKKQLHVQPTYRFFNGKSSFYQFGYPAILNKMGRVVMSKPEGSIHDSEAKIYAFKHHITKHPIDPLTRRLLPVKSKVFYETNNVVEALKQGTKSVGWPYFGHKYATTERYMGLFHEVKPKEKALRCPDCHESNDRIDFKALGYRPKKTKNGKPLCLGCHDSKRSLTQEPFFNMIHESHVKNKKIGCGACHTFSRGKSELIKTLQECTKLPYMKSFWCMSCIFRGGAFDDSGNMGTCKL